MAIQITAVSMNAMRRRIEKPNRLYEVTAVYLPFATSGHEAQAVSLGTQLSPMYTHRDDYASETSRGGSIATFLVKILRQGHPGAAITLTQDPRHLSYIQAFVPPRSLRIDSPRISMRWALCTSRSRMLSAKVGSPICSCHLATGSWLVKIVERT